MALPGSLNFLFVLFIMITSCHRICISGIFLAKKNTERF
jgi:hypothetical protein